MGSRVKTPRHRNRISTEDAEDEDVLDLWEQTNRPPDKALHQQRVNAWHPILDPKWVIAGLFYLGIIMIPVGFKIRSLQSSVIELSQTYDGYYVKDPICGIGSTYNANRTCVLEMEVVHGDMEAPVLVYYQLTNFYQNYRKYQQSFDPFQLYGETGAQSSLQASDCDPLNKLGNLTLNPCGLIANTFFNDVFKLLPGSLDSDGQPLTMLETGIAWQSDIDYMYKQPIGFDWEVCPNATCDASCCAGENWTCNEPYVDEEGNCYRFFYPNDNTTQYLYETYPGVISPLEGVENEHFIVWMRVAPTPQFRKLYGWFNQSIPNGTKLVFSVNANYAVEPFQGSKTLVISTNNIFGGRSNVTWIIFVGAGGFFLLAGAFFLAKHLFRPRRLGDPRYLHFKQE